MVVVTWLNKYGDKQVRDSKMNDSKRPQDHNKQVPEQGTRPQEINEKRLIDKLFSSFKQVGNEAIYQALVLYYTLQSPNTPAWCKTVVLGSLGYFISLIDGIPDLTPFLGYTDDISVMAATIAAISTHITSEIRTQAKQRQAQLFGKNATDTPDDKED